MHSLDQALDLGDLARGAALSPFHFHRIFRGMVGETPFELHRKLRLEALVPLPARLLTMLRGRERATNLVYARRMRYLFNVGAGSLLLLSPMGGLALPGKPWLSRTVFRSLERWLPETPVVFLGAYPRSLRHGRESWPLFSRHGTVVQGPVELAGLDYETATVKVGLAIQQLRAQVGYRKCSAVDY